MRRSDACPDVVVVGSAARDLAPDDRRGWRLGGGVTYGGLTLARLGCRTGVLVGVDEAGASAAELDLLRAAGADVRMVALPTTPVFDNLETSAGRIQTCLEPGTPLSLDGLPGAWRAAPTWLFAPVAGELSEDWADVPTRSALVGLAWQGLLRVLRAGERTARRPPAPSRLPGRADIIGVSRDDLDPGIALADLAAPLHAGVTLLLTDGPRGGLMLRRDGVGFARLVRYPAVASAVDVDATGAGDVLLASYLAVRMMAGSRAGTDDTALRLAAAAASLVVERPGLFGVPEPGAIAARLRTSSARA